MLCCFSGGKENKTVSEVAFTMSSEVKNRKKMKTRSSLSSSEVVWAERGTKERSWWPAVVEDDDEGKGKDGDMINVRFIGAKNRKWVKRDKVVAMDGKGKEVEKFKDQKLKEAVKEARMKKKKSNSSTEARVEMEKIGEVKKEDEEEKDEMVSVVTKREFKEDKIMEEIKMEKEEKKAKKVVAPVEKKKKVEISEYEKVRLDNIEKRKAMLAQLREEMSKFNQQFAKPKPIPKPRQFKRKLPYSSRSEPVRTRTRTRLNSGGSSNVSSNDSTPIKKYFSGGIGDDSDDELDGDFVEVRYRAPRESYTHPQKWLINPNENVPSPDEITDEMMDNVADRVIDKEYSQNGTTCHQCRQKTLDTKTVCRSGKCHGIRGYFCGVCLPNRYGEDVRAALKDPNWACPPCMGFCNCSICRNRDGRGATGILTPLALSKGFTNVKDYLMSLAKKHSSDEFDDE